MKIRSSCASMNLYRAADAVDRDKSAQYDVARPPCVVAPVCAVVSVAADANARDLFRAAVERQADDPRVAAASPSPFAAAQPIYALVVAVAAAFPSPVVAQPAQPFDVPDVPFRVAPQPPSDAESLSRDVDARSSDDRCVESPFLFAAPTCDARVEDPSRVVAAPFDAPAASPSRVDDDAAVCDAPIGVPSRVAIDDPPSLGDERNHVRARVLCRADAVARRPSDARPVA